MRSSEITFSTRMCNSSAAAVGCCWETTGVSSPSPMTVCSGEKMSRHDSGSLLTAKAVTDTPSMTSTATHAADNLGKRAARFRPAFAASKSRASSRYAASTSPMAESSFSVLCSIIGLPPYVPGTYVISCEFCPAGQIRCFQWYRRHPQFRTTAARTSTA